MLENGNETSTSVVLTNSKEKDLLLCLEPWGDQYVMPPGASFRVLIRGPRDGDLEVDYAENQITIYGWSGSVISVLHNGAELGAGLWKRQPAPQTP